jgi:hypothetical protein
MSHITKNRLSGSLFIISDRPYNRPISTYERPYVLSISKQKFINLKDAQHFLLDVKKVLRDDLVFSSSPSKTSPLMEALSVIEITEDTFDSMF